MTSTLKSLCLVFFMTFAAPLVVPFFVGSAWAQAGKFPPLDPEILQKARGKVAVVFYWSTTCAVCRDSLPELRANAAGWQNKPFTLVTVNVDPKEADWLAYEKILLQLRNSAPGVTPMRQPLVPAPTKLPITLVVNSQGAVVARYEGRVAPEVWDAVADLLP